MVGHPRGLHPKRKQETRLEDVRQGWECPYGSVVLVEDKSLLLFSVFFSATCSVRKTVLPLASCRRRAPQKTPSTGWRLKLFVAVRATVGKGGANSSEIEMVSIAESL